MPPAKKRKAGRPPKGTVNGKNSFIMSVIMKI